MYVSVFVCMCACVHVQVCVTVCTMRVHVCMQCIIIVCKQHMYQHSYNVEMLVLSVL